MRHSPFTAFYDANVLYPAPLRDFLMHLALTGVYRARWSSQIHDEWKRNLLINRPELTREQLDRTSALMDKAVPDGLVPFEVCFALMFQDCGHFQAVGTSRRNLARTYPHQLLTV